MELQPDSSGKGQDPGLGPDLLCALWPAVAPLRAEAKCLPVCVLVEVGSRACRLLRGTLERLRSC